MAVTPHQLIVMPRRPRLEMPGIPMHITHRGNNRCAVFLDDEDFNHYRQTLSDALALEDIQLHAYALMSNHVHLLITAHSPGQFSRAMCQLGRRYVRYFNQRHGRSGTLWEGRYKSCLVGGSDYLLNVLRYIELNPVRAELVDYAENYRWSSARHHVGIQNDAIVSSHPCYIALGVERDKRIETYRAMLDERVNEDDRVVIRSHMQQERALGNLKFQLMVEKTLNRPARVRLIGRPRNEANDIPQENQNLF